MSRKIFRKEPHRGCFEYNKEINEIGNQKNRCGRKYVNRGIMQHRTVWKNFYNSLPRKIADLIKAKWVATKYQLRDVGVQVCWCVFIKMYLSITMLLCFHWNAFNIYTKMLSDYIRCYDL